MASQLHNASLDIASAVGEGAAAEFAAYITLYKTLPQLSTYFTGKRQRDRFS